MARTAVSAGINLVLNEASVPHSRCVYRIVCTVCASSISSVFGVALYKNLFLFPPFQKNDIYISSCTRGFFRTQHIQLVGRDIERFVCTVALIFAFVFSGGFYIYMSFFLRLFVVVNITVSRWLLGGATYSFLVLLCCVL